MDQAERGEDIQTDHFVVELDIQPHAAVCQDMIFHMDDVPDAPGRAWRFYFFREGTENVLYKNRLEDLRHKVEAAVVRRDASEKQQKKDQNTMESRLDDLLSLGRSSGFPNDRCKYVLVCSRLDKIEEWFKWICNVNWLLMLDLADRGASDKVTQLCKLYQEENIREISAVTGEQLSEDWGRREMLENLRIGDKVLHVSCSAKGTFQEWYSNVLSALSELIHAVFERGNVEWVERVLVVVVVADETCQAEDVQAGESKLDGVHARCSYQHL